MPVYKLTYFDTRGYAEASRQLFHLAGVAFEDNRIERAAFEKIKQKTPFGQLPVLKVDSFEIPQSAAIGRYLAKKFGFAGKTPEEDALADAIVDQFKDFCVSFRPLIVAQKTGKSVEEIEKIRKEETIPGRDSFFRILNGLLDKSTSGFLVGSGITWADLVVVDCLVTLEKAGLFVAKEHPKLAALKKKVHSAPKLKTYIANRPNTEM